MDSIAPIFQPTKVTFYLPNHRETGFLSNSYPCTFDIFGQSWLSAEHCFQAQNTNLGSPAAMIECMRLCVAAKFFQNEDLRLLLLNRKYERAMFVHVDPTDSFWGAGAAGYGCNQLGKLITIFRQEYCYSQTAEFAEIERLAVYSMMNGNGCFSYNDKHYVVTNGYRSDVPATGEFVMAMFVMTAKVVYRVSVDIVIELTKPLFSPN